MISVSPGMRSESEDLADGYTLPYDCKARPA